MATGSLTIGIDARAAAEVLGGRGRYVRELLRELARLEDAHRYRLYARRAQEGLGLDERFKWVLRARASMQPVSPGTRNIRFRPMCEGGTETLSASYPRPGRR